MKKPRAGRRKELSRNRFHALGPSHPWTSWTPVPEVLFIKYFRVRHFGVYNLLQHYVTRGTLWFGCYWQQFYVVHVQVLLGACTLLCDEQERPLVNKIDEKKRCDGEEKKVKKDYTLHRGSLIAPRSTS